MQRLVFQKFELRVKAKDLKTIAETRRKGLEPWNFFKVLTEVIIEDIIDGDLDDEAKANEDITMVIGNNEEDQPIQAIEVNISGNWPILVQAIDIATQGKPEE